MESEVKEEVMKEEVEEEEAVGLGGRGVLEEEQPDTWPPAVSLRALNEEVEKEEEAEEEGEEDETAGVGGQRQEEAG